MITQSGAEVTSFEFFSAGDVVRVKSSGLLCRLTKVNQVNVKMRDAGGHPWIINMRGIVSATPEEIAKFEADETVKKPAEDPGIRTATLGTVVEFVKPYVKGKTDTHGRFVVIGLKPDGLKLARLGGDGGRYFPSIRFEDLKVVSV